MSRYLHWVPARIDWDITCLYFTDTCERKTGKDDDDDDDDDEEEEEEEEGSKLVTNVSRIWHVMYSRVYVDNI